MDLLVVWVIGSVDRICIVVVRLVLVIRLVVYGVVLWGLLRVILMLVMVNVVNVLVDVKFWCIVVISNIGL